MDFMKIGTQLLMKQFTKQGASPSEGLVQKAVSSLFGGGGAASGLSIGSILGQMQQGGMAEQLSSWIGTGENKAITGEQVEQTFGAEKLQALASEMGVEVGQVKSSLQEALPQMVDQASPEGKLPDSLGSLSGIAGMAAGLFGK